MTEGARPPASAAAPQGSASHALGILALTAVSKAQRRFAVAMVAGSLALLVLLAPIARAPWPRLPGVVAVYDGMILAADLLTAVMLLGQFAQVRRRSLLFVAGGYVFSAVIAITHVMTYPGALTPDGLLGGGEQATSWIYAAWHAGFPISLLAYSLADRGAWGHGATHRPGLSILATILIGAGAAIGAAAVVGSHSVGLPPLIHRDSFSSLVGTGGLINTLVGSAGIVTVLWWRRERTALDAWLMVVLTIWFCELSLTSFLSSARYQLGWYAGRLFGGLAASFVLAMLIVETQRLYGQLALAMAQAEAQHQALTASQEELARAQRLETIGRFTGGIAHDFNNLLTAIIGGLDLIARRPDDPARISRLAANAMEAARRGARLVAQIQTFALRRSLSPQRLDLSRHIADLAPIAEHLAGPGVSLALALEPAPCPVLADPVEVEAALLNLVSNARDAIAESGRPGRVVIATRLEGASVVLSVEDDGPGMSAEVSSRVFEPFFTTKPVGKGTGLGLSQVYGFAQGAGGEAKVITSLQAGARIEIRLPLAEDVSVPDGFAAPAAEPHPPLPPDAAGLVAGRLVAVVDDDPAVLAATLAALEDLGHRGVGFEDGPGMMAWIAAGGAADLLITDAVLRGPMDGDELAKAVRAARPALPILIMSGQSARALGLQAATPHLAKPFTREALAAAMNAAIRAVASGDGSLPGGRPLDSPT